MRDPVFTTSEELEAWEERRMKDMLAADPETFGGLDICCQIHRVRAAHALAVREVLMLSPE